MMKNNPESKKTHKRRGLTSSKSENIAGYLFIAPLFIGLIFTVIIPIISSFYFSFTDWNFIKGMKNINFIGLDNFKELFSDPVFLKSLLNNVILLLVVPIGLFISLVFAVIINKYVYFKDFFKIIYFMPFISSIVAIAIVYQVLFHPTDGPVNKFLMSMGIENPPMWLADPSFALISVMIIIIWTQFGLQLILYLAALQNIPRDLYEAAEIDGASQWQQFRKITMPLVTPTTFLLMISGIIHTFKVFDLIYVLTEGGPANSTTIPVFYLYEQAFVHLESGYASAVAIVILAIVLLITVIQWIGQKKWVNY